MPPCPIRGLRVFFFGALRFAAPLLALALCSSGCRVDRVNTKPLDDAGFSYSSIDQLRELNITNPEVAELVKARNGQISEQGCVDLLRIARGHKEHFEAGETVASLRAAGISESAVLDLARARQLGMWAGEALAIRLTGVSDRVIVALARRRAAGQSIPTGASLAHMRDAGIGEPTMYELVANRGITDQDAKAIAQGRKRRGATDEIILRDYPPKQ